MEMPFTSTFPVPAAQSKSVVLKLPFVSDLDAAQAADLDKLDYGDQRRRTVAYWKSVVQPDVRFTVPEPKFNDFLRSVIAHMHISTTKDPKTGLYMVPAASLSTMFSQMRLASRRCCWTPSAIKKRAVSGGLPAIAGFA